LLKWNFNELLDVAYNAGWLPAAAATNDPEELKKIDLASFGHVVRRVRNLVHAAKYLKEMKGKDVTPAFLRSCFKISLGAYDCLVKALAGRKKRN
jgi:hypothetical protein